MNSDALITFLVLLGGLLTITIFFYGGQVLLHWLEVADSPQALASFVKPTTQNSRREYEADAISALNRFDDDGGNQT
jgi:hypothetical protein